MSTEETKKGVLVLLELPTGDLSDFVGNLYNPSEIERLRSVYGSGVITIRTSQLKDHIEMREHKAKERCP